MPIPVILGVGAAIAGVAGIGSGVRGAMKMKEANDTMSSANSLHSKNIARFEKRSKSTNQIMDNLGEQELRILESFDEFSNVFERIHNKPEFKTYHKDDVSIPDYDAEELKKVSVGAGVLLGGIGGAAVGTAGGFAAAGATTAAVMAFGTASTGTAIASLSGAAAVNATLAALGGGAIGSGSAIAGGMALGTTVLGAATLGVGLLVGGVIFNITGSSLSDKADEAWSQMKKAEKEISKICSYLFKLGKIAAQYNESVSKVDRAYRTHLQNLSTTVITNEKTDWSLFTEEEKLITQNTVLLVNLLYQMCKVQLVLISENDKETNIINKESAEKAMSDAEQVFQHIACA